ncbi:HTH domain-containing protein [Candidatus Pacearchaeota archaeon]|nr:HTH domain-containing protein [Candidatus Pacearchaeota archaeon]
MQKIIEEKPFPSKLEDRLASVANAINTELKIATLLHLDDTPREASEIRQRVRETIERGYLPKTETFMAYGNTLHDIALVAKETVVRDTGEVAHVGYSLTEAGKRYGLPASAISLEYSVGNDISLFQILGSTASKGDSRAPDNRMKILEELRKKRELREADLTDVIGLNSYYVIQGHLIALAKIGFIAYESIGAKSKGKFTYGWIRGRSPNDVRTIVGHATLTRRIVDYLAHHDTAIDCNTLSEVLEYKYPNIISQILSGLEKQGFVKRASPWISREIKSSVRILDKGKEFHDEIYLQLVELLSDHSLDGYQEKVLAFRESEQFSDNIIGGIELYRSVSPNINRKSSSERKEQIKHLIINNHGLTSGEIAEKLHISTASAYEYITQLSGIRKEKEEHEIRYYIDE